MAENVINLRGSTLIISKIFADSVEADDISPDNNLPASIIGVAAGTDGLAADDLQDTLQALATRIQALEDA